MFENQQHLITKIAYILKKTFDNRIDALVQEELARQGKRLYDFEQYKRQRVKYLARYDDETLLKLARELSLQLAERSILHAPNRNMGNTRDGVRVSIPRDRE
jgi:hypothetical protein